MESWNAVCTPIEALQAPGPRVTISTPGRPVAFALTPGNVHDLVGAGVMLERVPTPERLIADRAYDARSFRDWLAERGCEAVIPPNPTRKHPHSYDREAYKARNLVEALPRLQEPTCGVLQLPFGAVEVVASSLDGL